MRKIKKQKQISHLISPRRLLGLILRRTSDQHIPEWEAMPRLLSLRETAKLLNVHPNTLRLWDQRGILPAVRIGQRQDRRYERQRVQAAWLQSRPSETETVIARWVSRREHLRSLHRKFTRPLAFGLSVVVVFVIFSVLNQARAGTTKRVTTLVEPVTCTGWQNPERATSIDLGNSAEYSLFSAKNSAVYDATQFRVQTGQQAVTTGNLDGLSDAIVCQHFSLDGISTRTTLSDASMVLSLATKGGTNATGTFRVETTYDGTNWSTLKVLPASAEAPTRITLPLPEFTRETAAKLQFRIVPEIDIESSTVTAFLDGVGLQVTTDATTPASAQKNKQAKNDLDNLVEFSKSSYQALEEPVVTIPKKEVKKFLSFTVKNVSWTLDKVQVQDLNAKDVAADYHTADARQGDSVESVVTLNTSTLHPGKYRVKVYMHNDAGGEAVVERDMLWGVVALNYERSSPQPNKQEQVGMAILDDRGRTICDADLTVKVQDPHGHTTTYQSGKRTITSNPNCIDKGVTNEPDYHFTFTPQLSGTYHVSLQAKTKVGQRNYEDNLLVTEHQGFDVQRTDYPTRINPYAAYPVRIAITPHQDYIGPIIERVPADFKISSLPMGASVEDDPTHPGMKRIVWQVNWQHENTYYVTYTFVAPAISPALFMTGPLSIGGNDLFGSEFTEQRQWQIASDSASSISWDGSSSALWSDPANWSTNAIPQAGDNLVFPAGAANYSNTNDLGENMWFNSITFYDSGYTLSGNTIIMGQGQGATSVILPGITDAVSSGGNTISLNLRFDATRLISVTNTSETLTISGTIDGVGGLSKEGTGELVLSGANTFGGVVKVNGGVLNAQNATALGTIATGTEVVGEAALELQGTIAIGREALTLRGYGVSSAGALRNVQDNNSFDGQITIAGTTEIASDSGTLTLNGGVTGTFNLNLDGAGNITFAKAPIAISTGLLTKNGSGTTTYNFPNTYTGLTTVNNGAIEYGCDNAILSGGITVNGGTLDMNTYSDMVGTVTLGTLMGATGTITGSTGVLSSAVFTLNAGTVSAIIAGDVPGGTTQVTKQTPGTVTLTRPNLFTGAVAVSVGLLKIQDSNALGMIDGATTVSSGASLQIDGSSLSVPEWITISGVGLLNKGAIFNTTGNNAVTGLVTLAAASTIESDTSTTLTFSNAGFTGTFGLTFDCTGNVAVSGPINTSSGTLTKDGPGDLTLSAYNPFTGATVVNYGTLTLNGSGTITTSASIDVRSGSKLKIDNSSTVADRIGDASAVTMNGGDLEMYGNSSTSTMATAGTLTMSSGQNTITVFAAAGGSTILRFTSLARSPGATGLFRGTSLGATPAANVATILFTQSPTLTGDDGAPGTPTVSVIQGIFGDDSTSGTGTDMVTYGLGNNNGVRLLNGAGFSNEYTNDYLVTNANVKVTTGTAAVTTQINSLILGSGASITNPGSAQTITFKSGNILNLQSSGSIAGANTTLAGGSTEFIIRTPQNLDISSLITTTGGLSKSGTGTLTFSTSKTYTGLTSINAGTFLYGTNDAISSGNLTINDATVDIATYTDSVGAVVVQGATLTGSSGVLTATSYDLRASTISAIIAGTGTTTISNTNERVDATTIMSRDNTYSGTTSISSGVLKLGAAGGGTNTPLGTAVGTTSITNGAMLDLNGFTLGTAEAINTFRGTGIAGQGAIINSSSTPVTYSGALTIATSARIGADYGKITISGSISGATLPLTVGGFGDIDITGVIGTTSGTVTKDGFGTYTPSNSNTYTGATTITAGVLKLGAAGGGTNTPLGTNGTGTTVSAASTSGAGYLDLNGYTLGTAEALTLNGIGTGTGDFASGALTNTGASATWSGLITLGSASLIDAATGAINITNAGTISGAFGITLAGSGGGSIVSIIGTTTGTVTKIDTGTWNLSGASTYTGATTIYQGTLQLGATGGVTNTPLGTTGAGTTVYSGGVLDLNGFTLGTLEAFTLNGFGVANGGCVVNNSASGVNFSGNRTLGSDIRVTNSGAGALTWSGTSAGVFETRIGGAGNHTLSGAWAATAATVWKDGAGNATASVAQGWTGNTTVIAGTMTDGALNGLSSGNVIVAGGTFDLSTANADTVGAVWLIDGTISSSGGSSAILTGTAYTFESGTVSGILAGAVAVTKNTAGVVAITGAETFSGAMTINAGEVQLSGAGTAVSVTGVTVNLGGTLTLDNSSNSQTSRLGDAIVVTMNGGNFNFKGSSSTTAAETIGQLALAAGHNVVTVTPGAGGSTTLTWGNNPGISRTNGATVLFRGTSLGATAAANVSTIKFTTAPTLNGGGGNSGTNTVSIIKGAYGDGSLSGTGTDMVTYTPPTDTSTSLRLLTSGEYVSNSFATANANVKITTNTAAATSTINSIIINGGDITNPGTAQTITTSASGTGVAGNVLVLSANNIAGANTTITTTNNIDLTVLANANTTISTLIGSSSSSNLVVSGNSTVTLSGANTYTGTTFINNGHSLTTKATLTAGASNVISTGGVTVVGGTYNLNGNSDSVGAITLTGGTVASGAGTLTTTGTLATVANANVSSIITGTLAVPTAATFNIADGLVENDAVISAVVTSASTSLTKSTGTGVVVLSGQNTYTGATTISTGTVRYGTTGNGTNGPLGTSAGATTVASGAALDLCGYTPSPSDALTISGTGISTKGALLNTSSTSVSYSGLITLGAAATIQSDYGDINITNAGTITGATFGLTLRGAGNGTLSSIVGTTSGTIVKNDLGTWTLSGSNTYTGVTTITLGVLKLGAAGNGTNTPFGTSAGGITIASTAMLDLNGYTLGTAEALTSVSGTGIANAGAITTSSGSSTSYSGAITMAAASRITNFGAGAFTASGAIAGNFALTTVNAPGDITLGTGVWSGTGTLVKEGWGTTILSGQNTMTGAMTVSSGTLKVGANGGATNTPLGTIAGGVTVSAGAVLDLSTFVVGGASTWEPLTLNGTGINNNGALISSASSGNSFGAMTVSSNSRVVNSGSGTITFAGTVTIANVINLGVGGTGPTTISGLFGASATTATLTKWDSGLLLLSNATNATTGLTRVNGGTLREGAGGAISSGPVTVAGGTFDINGVTEAVGAVTLISGTITDSNGTPGSLTGTAYTFYGGAVSGILGGTSIAMAKSTGGVLTINKSLTNTGTLTVSAGTTQYLATNVLSNSSAVNVNGGTLDIGANSDTVAGVTLTSGFITGSGGTLTGSSYAVMSGSISAILAGAVNLTKTTAGTVTLSGTNTYTGITTISAGTLSVGTIGNGGVAGNLGQATNSAANLVFNTGTATLAYTGGSASTDRNITTTALFTVQIDITNPATALTWAGATTATTAPYTKIGPGTLILTGSNLHTGLNSVLAGTLKLGAANVLVTGGLTVANGTFDLNNFSDSLGAITLSKDGQIIDSGGSTAVLTTSAAGAYQGGTISARIGGSSASAFTKTTTDRIVLAGDNTHTSTAVTLSAGTLNLQSNNALGASGTGLLVTETSGAVIEAQNNITVPSTKTFNISGTGNNAGGAIKNVADANTLSGAITLGATGVRINANGGTLTLNGAMSGATFAVTFGGSGNITYGGVIGTTTGTVTKDGTGTYSPTNTNTYTGLTTVSAGVLVISTAQSTGTTGGGVTVASGAAVQIQGTTTVGAEALTLNGGGISNDGALRSTSGTNVWQGAVTLNTTSDIGVDANQLTISGTITGGAGIGLDKDGAATLVVNTTTLGGDMTIAAGTLSASGSSAISVAGNWSNSGTFTANTSTVTLNGTAQQTVSGTLTGTSAFNALTVTNAFGDGSTTWSVVFSGDVQTNATFTATTASTKLRFNAGSTYTFQNITLNGQASGTRVFLRSSSSGSKWYLNVAGTRSVQYTDVKDSDATGSGTPIDATGGTNQDSTGNTYWTFVIVTIAISGNIYTDDASTPLNCSVGGSRTVAVKVNGSGSYTGTCSLSTGAYSVSGIIVGAADDVLTVFLSGATEKAVTVTLAADTTSNITGLPLRTDRLVVAHENAGPITNNATTGLGKYDKDDDATNFFFTANSNNLTLDAGKKLVVNSGDTYTPGGTVTTPAASTSGNPDSDILIQSSATMSMGTNALSIGGDFTNSGTLTVSGGQTTTFTATGSGFSVTPGSGTYQAITFNGAGGGWTIGSALNSAGVFTLIAGTVTANAAMNLTGVFSQTGGTFVQGANIVATFSGATFTLANGTTWTKTSGTGKLVFDGTVSYADNNTTKQNLGAVQIGASPGTTTLTTDMSADSVTIPNTDTLNTKGYDVTTTGAFDCQSGCTLDLTSTGGAGNGTILDIGGDMSISSGATFTAFNDSKVFMNSTSGANTNRTWTTGGKTYNDVELKNAGTSNDQITLSGNLDVNGTFTLTDGTIKADTNNPNTNTSGNISIASGVAYTKGSGTWTFDGSGTNTWTDSTSAVQDLGAVAINGSSKTINLGSSAKATTLTIAASQTFGLGSSGYTLTLTGSGTGVNRPLTDSGTLNEGSNSTVKYVGTSNTDLYDEIYNNLTLAPASGSPTYNYGAEGASTIDVTGLLTVGDGSHAVTLDTNFDDGMNINDMTVNAAATWNTNGINGQSLTGNLVMNGTLVQNDGLGFTATTTGHTISGSTLTTTGALTGGVTFSGAGGGWTFTSDAALGSFGITAGAVTQGANINLTVSSTWNTSSGTTFTKASGSGTITFDGTAAQTFTDSTAGLQNLGKVSITKTNGTPANNKITLASSMLVDTLTVSTNNTLDLANAGYTLNIANAGSSSTPFVVSGTLTPNSSSTVKFTATNSGGNITVPSVTYASLDCSPSSAETYDISDATTVTDTLTVGTNATVAIASTKTLTLSKNTATSLVLNGATSGSGALVYQNSATTVTTSGTIGSGFTFDVLNGNETIPNRTFGGLVTALNTSGSARTVLIAASSTPTFTGLDLKTTGAGTLLFDAATNNPTTVTVSGNLTTSAASGAVTLSMGSGNWAVSGNVDLTNITTFNNNSGTLTMGGTGTLTSNGKTLYNVALSGTVTLANATHTLAGNLNLTGGTITPGTSGITMSGASKTIDGGGQTLYDLTINAATTLQNTDLTISHTLAIASATTFTNTGRTLTDIGTAITFGNSTSTLAGTGTLRFTNASTGVGGTGGSINCVTRYDASGGDIASTSVTNRTYKNKVEFYSNSASNRKVTLAVGTFTLTTSNGLFAIIADGSGNMTVDASVSVSNISAVGGFDFTGTGGGSEVYLNGSGNQTFSGGNVDFTGGTFTAGTGTLTLSSSITQTLTTAGNTLYNFSAPGQDVGLASGTTVTVTNNFSASTGIWRQDSDTILMTGTGGTFEGGDNIFTNVTIDPATTGTTTLVNTGTNISGTLTIASGDTLNAGNVTLGMIGISSTLVLNGTLSGTAGVYYESSNIFPTTGTVTVPIWFVNDNDIDLVVPARTFGGLVEFDYSISNPHSTVLGTAGGQTINFNGGVKIGADGSGNITVTGATYNPTINVVGDVQHDTDRGGVGTLTMVTGTGNWTVNGNVNLTSIVYTATSGNTLTMTGTSKTITSAGNALHHLTQSGGSTTLSGTTTLNGDLTISSGTLTAPSSGSLAIAGNFSNSGTFSHNSSTVTMSGTSATIQGSATTTFNNLTISGTSTTIAAGGSDENVDGALTVNSSKALTIGTGRIVYVRGNTGTTVSLSGTMNGPGRLVYQNSATTFPTGGTLASGLVLRFDTVNGNMTVPARTDYGTIEAYKNGTIARTVQLGTSSGQTITLSGNLDLQNGNATNSLTVDASVGNTINPTINVGGNVATSLATGLETLSMGSGTWTVSGNFDLTNIGTFNNNSGTLAMNGTSKTVNPNGNALYNFTVSGGTVSVTGSTMTVSNAVTLSGGTFTAPSSTLSVGTNWTNSGGSFTPNGGTVSFTTNNNTTISGSTTFNNLTITDTVAKTVTFVHATTTTVSGAWTVTGATGQLVTLTRDNTSAWNVNPSAATVDYVDVNYSNNTGTAICATHSVSTYGGNTGWSVSAGTSCGVTLSGTVYQTSNEASVFDCSAINLALRVSVNGATASTGTCTAVGGTFSVTMTDPGAADVPVTLYTDSTSNPSQKATTVTLSSGAGNITGVTLIIDRVVVSQESGTAITNAHLATAKTNGDAGIRYSVSSGNLTVDSGMELHVLAGKTFTPGGNVTTNTTGGTIHVPSTAVFTGGANTITAGADFTNAGTFTNSGGTLTMSGTGTLTSGGATLNNLTVNTAGTTTLANAALAVGGNLTLTTGTLTMGSATPTISGNLVFTAGTVNANTSTITMNGAGATIDGNGKTLNDLTIANTSGTITAQNTDLTVSGVLTVNSGGGSLTINSGRTVTVSGTSGTTLTLNGTITGAGRLTYKNQATAFPATGTISSILRMDANGGNQTIGGTNSATRSFGGTVEIFNGSSATASTVTLENGTARTFTFGGDVTIWTTSTKAVTLSADTTTDPVVNVTGNLSYTKASSGVPGITSGNNIWTVSGDANFTNGSYTATTGNEFKMDGTSKTLTGGAFYKLTSNGVILQSGTSQISNVLTVNSGKSITASGALFETNAATISMTGGTIDGSGSLYYQNSGSFPTNGTLNIASVNFTPFSGSVTIPGRTYGGDVNCNDNGIAGSTCTLSGTIIINGSLAVNDTGTGATLNGSPTSVTIGGSVVGSNSGGLLGFDMNGAWSVGGNFDTAPFTSFAANSSSLTMDAAIGSATLSVGSNEMHDLTLQPASGKTLIVDSSGVYLRVNNNVVLGGSGTLTTTGVTFLMINGTTATFDGGNKTIYGLAINKDTTLQTNGLTVSNLLTINGAILTLTGVNLINTYSSDVNWASGSIVGTGILIFPNGAGGPGTGGTISAKVRFDATNGDIASTTFDARTYSGNVEPYNNSGTSRTITMASGTYTLSGSSSSFNPNANAAGNLTIDGSANNPTVTIGGDLDFTGTGDGTEVLSSGTGTWTVSGNVNLTSGVFAPSVVALSPVFSDSAQKDAVIDGGTCALSNTYSCTGSSVDFGQTHPQIGDCVGFATTDEVINTRAGIEFNPTSINDSATITGAILAGTVTSTYPTSITVARSTQDDLSTGTNCSSASGMWSKLGGSTYGTTDFSATGGKTVPLGLTGVTDVTSRITGTTARLSIGLTSTTDNTGFGTLTNQQLFVGTTTSTSSTLVMNGASKTLTTAGNGLYNITFSGTGTTTLADNLVIFGNATMNSTISAGTTTVTMAGAGKTLVGGTATLNNLTINNVGTGTTTLGTSDLTVSGLLSVAASNTLSISSGITALLSGTSGTTLTLSGTISGAGRLTYRNQATAFPATGTISSILRMDGNGGNQTIGGTNSATRTFGGVVEIYNNSSATASTITLENGTSRTFAFGSDLTIWSANTKNVTLTADTATDPLVTVTGNISYTKSSSGTPSITSGGNTWTVSGDVNFTNGAYTATSGNKITMNGAGKTLTGISGVTLYDLTTSANVTAAGSVKVSHALATTGGTSLTISGSVNTQASATITNSGSIAGSGTLTYQNGGSPSLGTINVTNMVYSPDNGTITISGSYGGNLTCQDSLINPAVCTLSGTVNVTGNFMMQDVNNGVTVSGTPTMTIGGALSVNSSLNSTFNLGGTWNVAGTVDLSTLTTMNNTGTLVLNGSLQQSITTGGVVSLGNVTVTNASGSNPDSSPSVIFADSVVGGGTLTAATNDVKLRFDSASTYSWSALTLTGTSGHLVTVRSSTPGTAPTFNVGAGSRSVSYTSVKDSNACGSSGGAIDATNGTNTDLGNANCWLINSLTVTLSGASVNLTGVNPLSPSNVNYQGITSTVTTSAANGYVSVVSYSGALSNGTDTLADAGGTATAGTSGFGVSTSKSTQNIATTTAPSCTTTQTQNSGPYAASSLSTTPQQFASSASAATSDLTTLCFLAAVSGTQAPGAYSSTVTLVTTARF